MKFLSLRAATSWHQRGAARAQLTFAFSVGEYILLEKPPKQVGMFRRLETNQPRGEKVARRDVWGPESRADRGDHTTESDFSPQCVG